MTNETKAEGTTLRARGVSARETAYVVAKSNEKPLGALISMQLGRQDFLALIFFAPRGGIIADEEESEEDGSH